MKKVTKHLSSPWAVVGLLIAAIAIVYTTALASDGKLQASFLCPVDANGQPIAHEQL